MTKKLKAITCKDMRKEKNIFTIKNILSIIFCDGELIVTYIDDGEQKQEIFNSKTLIA